MATNITLNKTIEKASAVSGLWSLTLSDVNGILLGMRAEITGFMTAAYNVANITVLSVNTTTKVVTYQHANATVAEFAPDANFHLQVSWVDNAFVTDMLGFVPTGDDLDYLTADVDAANDFCFRKRQEAGWDPHPAYPAGSDVRLGCGLYAMMLYRERGTSGDSYASFNSMGQFDRPISLARVMQLLGCGRAQVA